jgi:hypothetical protein
VPPSVVLDRFTTWRTLVLIDCDTCEVRGHACGDCVMTYLLGSVPQAADGADGAADRTAVELDADEQEALRVLADSGMVPPLRLVPPARSVTLTSRRPDSGDAEPQKRHGMKSAG